MEKRYYVAYGSNLNVRQMLMRCPTARMIGTSVIQNYRLLFKGSKTGSYLTIEPATGSEVPVGVWEVSKADELALDHYEGFWNIRRMINSTGTTYQFELCTLALGASGIASIYSSAGSAAVRIPIITSDLLGSSCVITGKIASNAVTNGKLATGAVSTDKLADDSVTAAKIADGAVGSAALESGSVIADKLGAASVTAAKIGASAVETAKIADAAVTTAKIADSAITMAKLGATVTIAKGGTGATDGATALKNLLAAGATILSSNQYGTSLPSTATAGRLFFKKV